MPFFNLEGHSPSRWEAQADAVNLIFSAKTQSNPESSVGLMNMAGKGPEMLVTLTTDFGKLLDGMHRTKIRGHAHLSTAIQIAGVRHFHSYAGTLDMLSMLIYSLPLSIDRISPSVNASLSFPALPYMKIKRILSC